VPQMRTFHELIERVRAGDQQAAAEIVRRYEPEIHKAIRSLLLTLRLHRIVESADISQCVLSNFFIKTRAAWFELDSPEQLLKLLVTMARNQVRDEARRHQAYRRDRRRIARKFGPDLMENIVDVTVCPSKFVAGRDFVNEVYRRLSVAERELAQARVLGTSWATLAAERGGKPGALRIRMKRALNRVFHQLGLKEALGP
jgi:DNA-directed RNA polymerase specialized sigma24 family protein